MQIHVYRPESLHEAAVRARSRSGKAFTHPREEGEDPSHLKTFAWNGQEVEGASTSSVNKSSTERLTKKLYVAFPASVMHVRPLHRDDDADDPVTT